MGIGRTGSLVEAALNAAYSLSPGLRCSLVRIKKKKKNLNDYY